MMRPSFISLRTLCPALHYIADNAIKDIMCDRQSLRELALLISVVSLGSSQIFLLPHFSTMDAKRFWRRRVLYRGEKHRFH